ncbi:MAG: hypothetical protein ABI836_02940 [Gemmatimonadota bacterium]
MSVRKWLGMDLVDLVIQVAVTGCLAGWVSVSRGPDEVYPMIIGASFLVWGVRRHIALKRMAREELSEGSSDRVADLEDRVRDLESLQNRMLELEERVDFTERLLARQHEPDQLPK